MLLRNIPYGLYQAYGIAEIRQDSQIRFELAVGKISAVFNAVVYFRAAFVYVNVDASTYLFEVAVLRTEIRYAAIVLYHISLDLLDV